MENKYYIPSIEEFHVGFEYEWNKKTYVVEKEDFESPKCPGIYDNDWDNMLEALKDGDIRVKHLDREDIESVLDLKVFSFIFKDNILELRVKGESKYKGICKNKSELKRIAESIR